MVDLKGQYEFIKEEVQTSFNKVLSTTSFINGPAVKEFQEDLEHYLGVKARNSMCQWNRCIANCINGVKASARG